MKNNGLAHFCARTPRRRSEKRVSNIRAAASGIRFGANLADSFDFTMRTLKLKLLGKKTHCEYVSYSQDLGGTRVVLELSLGMCETFALFNFPLKNSKFEPQFAAEFYENADPTSSV